MSDLRAKITDVLSSHEYAGKPGGPDCGGVCDCPELCTCGAEVRSWRQHTADAVMGVIEARVRDLEAERDEARHAARTYLHNGARLINERAMEQHRLEEENQRLRDVVRAAQSLVDGRHLGTELEAALPRARDITKEDT